MDIGRMRRRAQNVRDDADRCARAERWQEFEQSPIGRALAPFAALPAVIGEALLGAGRTLSDEA